MLIRSRHKSMNLKKMAIVATVAAAIIVASCLYILHRYTKPIIDLKEVDYEYLYIPTNASFADVEQLLLLNNWLTDKSTFESLSALMGYDKNVKAGRYKISNHINAQQLVSLLRSGHQQPVNLTFNNIRTVSQLAGVADRYIEADSLQLLSAMTDSATIATYGFNRNTVIAMFIPNTYQFHWNTSATQWMERMNKEWQSFWTDERRHKADSVGLTPIEVSILASIVDEETSKNDEKPTVAGLYLNRLRNGIPLQADPTVKFALGNFALRRILKRDLEIDSPYNTYKYAGLPPGPIRLASITAIDAVLNAQNHKYLYMCAKEDFSGHHNFAKTLDEHNRNAAKYRRALSRECIFR